MKKEEIKKCPNKATHVYAWGGKFNEACLDHTKAMVALGEAMGSRVEARRLKQESKNNCIHFDDLHE